jgi:hypothetical protein
VRIPATKSCHVATGVATQTAFLPRRVRLRVAAARQQLIASIRLTRGTLIATRKMLVDVGLIEETSIQSGAH